MEHREKAIAFIERAIECEKSDLLQEALENYLYAFDWFTLYLKYEKNQIAKDKVRQKVKEYVTRAEHIKKELKGSGGVEATTAATGVSFKDVIGLDAAKDALREAAILPKKLPKLFDGIKPWRGILLYGPPGTGKTHLARALATEAQCSFFCASSADLMDKYVGQSERNVRQLFEKARENRPSVVFLDEIDSICANRGEHEGNNRALTEFLVQTDGAVVDNNQVLIVGATNLPWNLDQGMRRRFEKRIYIPLPNLHDRAALFKMHAPFLSTNQLYKLAELTEGYSCADVTILIRDAMMQKVRKVTDATHFKAVEGGKLTPCSPGDDGAREMTWESVDDSILAPPDVSFRDFIKSVETSKPSVAHHDLQRYEQWTNDYGIE